MASLRDKSVEILRASEHKKEVGEFLQGLDPVYAQGLIEMLRGQFKLLSMDEGPQKTQMIVALALSGVALVDATGKQAPEIIKDLNYLEDKVYEASKQLHDNGVDLHELAKELRESGFDPLQDYFPVGQTLH